MIVLQTAVLTALCGLCPASHESKTFNVYWYVPFCTSTSACPTQKKSQLVGNEKLVALNSRYHLATVNDVI